MFRLSINISAIIIFTLTGVLLNSCEDSLGLDQYVKTEEKVFIKPLNIGNYWDYSVVTFDEKGISINETTQRFAITATQLINSEKWFIEDKGFPSNGVTETIINKEDGLWTEKGSSEFNPDTPIKIISYPIVPGARYLISRFTSKVDNITREVYREATYVNILIKTPAGTFKCIEYYDIQTNSDGSILQNPTNISYYAPNFGLIERKYYRTDDNGKDFLYQKWQLTGYNIIPASD